MTTDIRHDGIRFTITIGLQDNEPKEVFADRLKVGTTMSHLLADACVLISIALQCGSTPEDLSKSLGVVPDPANGEDAVKPASALGAIVDAMKTNG